MKRYAAAALSLVGGWLLASILMGSLAAAGFDLAASTATTWQQYSTYRAIEILIPTIVLAWALHRVIGRYVFGFKPDERPFVERLPAWVRHPSPVGLVITWIVAPFTFVLYPVAAYMSWRFYSEWRANARTCPRCAERIKAEALVCRHCGHELEPFTPVPPPIRTIEPSGHEVEPSAPVQSPIQTIESQPVQAPAAPASRKVSIPADLTLWIAFMAVALTAAGVVWAFGLAFLGPRVTLSGAAAAAPAAVAMPTAGPPPCVIVMDGPEGRIELYLPGSSPAACETSLADTRKGFGPDTASYTLYSSTVPPVGTPDCIVGAAWVYTSGPTAADLKTRTCSMGGS